MAPTTRAMEAKKRARTSILPASPLSPSADNTLVTRPTKRARHLGPPEVTTLTEARENPFNGPHLPQEIISNIAQNCSNGTLVSLAQSCKYFERLAIERLCLNNILDEGSSALFWAASHGEVNTIRNLLSTATTFNNKIPGCTLNIRAGPQQEIQSYGLGLDHKSKESIRKGVSPKDLKFMSQDLIAECLKEPIEFWRQPSGWTPMHLAAYYGHGDVIEFLQHNGLDIQVEDDEGHTPLFYAAHSSNFMSKIRVLTNFGADIDHVGGDDKTVISWACNIGYSSLVMRLIIANASIQHTSADGKNLLHHFSYSFRSKSPGYISQIIDSLKRRGLNLNLQDNNGVTPLHVLAESSAEDSMIEVFCKAGASINIQNDDGVTPVMSSFENEGKMDYDTISKRLYAFQSGGEEIDFELKDCEGATILVRAIQSRTWDDSLHLPKGLVNHGANEETMYDGEPFVNWVHDQDTSYTGYHKSYWRHVQEWMGPPIRDKEEVMDALREKLASGHYNFFDLVDELAEIDEDEAIAMRDAYFDYYEGVDLSENDDNEPDNNEPDDNEPGDERNYDGSESENNESDGGYIESDDESNCSRPESDDNEDDESLDDRDEYEYDD